jgi:hypothetical protein
LRADVYRCSDASEARAEPIFGTASYVRRWLLLEQPGPWGFDALSESRLPQSFTTELRRRARASGLRIVLIRRGARLSGDRRQAYFLRTDPADSYIAHVELANFMELLDIDLSPMREGKPIPQASEWPDPLFLICTHGRHDACCSIKGNVAARLACAEVGFDAWECSHIGGDRFAANLLCFPHGIYYGRVRGSDVVRLMNEYVKGSLSLEHYRGRCCYRFAEQAAEYFVRRELSLHDLDAVSLAEVSRTDDSIKATFSLDDGGRAEATVRVSREERQILTCNATQADPIPRYDLVSFDVFST